MKALRRVSTKRHSPTLQRYSVMDPQSKDFDAMDDEEWDKLNSDMVRIAARSWPQPTEDGRRFHSGLQPTTKSEREESEHTPPDDEITILDDREVKEWMKRAEETMFGGERSSSSARADDHSGAVAATLLDLRGRRDDDDDHEEELERERAKWVNLLIGFTLVVTLVAVVIIRAFGAREVVERLRFGADARLPVTFFTSDPRRVVEWQRRRIVDLEEEKATLLHRLSNARAETTEYQLAANSWKEAFARCVKRQRDACPHIINECPMRASPFQGTFYEFIGGPWSSILIDTHDVIVRAVQRFACPCIGALRDGYVSARRIVFGS